MSSIYSNFPPPDELINLEPEEIAVFILIELSKYQRNPINRHNLTMKIAIQDYAGSKIEEVGKVLSEAWFWLEKEGMVAPSPDQAEGWFFITRRGLTLQSHTDLQSYKKSGLLPEGSLDPVLARKVRPLFIRGDFETAVFQSFKEIEVRVRKYSVLPQETVGVDLMRKAFKPDEGPLADKSIVLSEQEAMTHLFAGAIGAFKNPTSHRNVDYQNPNEVAEIILFADMLLKIVEKHNNMRTS
jgi:uncharacterized protein (TIGR02391 family)